jgi:hypothetical protein
VNRHTTAATVGHPHAAEDWISRKQAAVLMGCSEDTVKRVIKKHGLTTGTGECNTVLVRLSDLVSHGKVAADNVPGTGNAAETLADLRRAEAALAEAREQVAAVTSRLEERAAIVEQLRAQLSAKDKQIEALHRSLAHLAAAAVTYAGNSTYTGTPTYAASASTAGSAS